ncbi:MAG: hypothetical protein JSW06_01130 [Thermoplasmatales archaeon]|nr:MAG: hypothetical protein JSW06_01130 [Thermoplasmatales archaeon]
MKTLNLIVIIIGAILLLSGLGVAFVVPELTQVAQFYGGGVTILLGIFLILVGFFYKK